MVNIADLTITSLDTITAFDISAVGSYLFTLDELQNASIAQTQEKVDITGKQGRKLNSLKRNKGVTISGTNGLISGGLLELQSGGNFVSKNNAEVLWVDYLTVDSELKATTAYKATGTVGNEIKELYLKNSDGTLGKKFEQGTTAADDKFTYDPTTKKIAFSTDEADVGAGDEIVVYYTRKIQADVLENLSDDYSKKCQLYVDATAEDTCANVYRIQFYIPKADFSGEFTFEMGENQSVHAFEAESLAGSCGSAGQFWTYTVFGANVADYDVNA